MKAALIGYLTMFAGVIGETVWSIVQAPPSERPELTFGAIVGTLFVALGGRLLHKARPPKPKKPPELEPTEIQIEDGGPELGKASGEAGAAAARGPFKKLG